MIVEMLDGGQIELTEDTQAMICYATSTHTLGSQKKRSWICADRADRKKGLELLYELMFYNINSVFLYNQYFSLAIYHNRR